MYVCMYSTLELGAKNRGEGGYRIISYHREPEKHIWNHGAAELSFCEKRGGVGWGE